MNGREKLYYREQLCSWDGGERNETCNWGPRIIQGAQISYISSLCCSSAELQKATSLLCVPAYTPNGKKNTHIVMNECMKSACLCPMF